MGLGCTQGGKLWECTGMQSACHGLLMVLISDQGHTVADLWMNVGGRVWDVMGYARTNFGMHKLPEKETAALHNLNQMHHFSRIFTAHSHPSGPQGHCNASVEGHSRQVVPLWLHHTCLSE
uniref:Uncharacterized protein n=1 Tax=Eutreptiella gymnastica TaxID=73025 RepID=A0A7S4CWB5_9EUGL